MQVNIHVYDTKYNIFQLFSVDYSLAIYFNIEMGNAKVYCDDYSSLENMGLECNYLQQPLNCIIGPEGIASSAF